MKASIMTRLKRLDRPIRYKFLMVPHPVCTLALLFFLFQRDGTGLARLSLAAALWHESGHLLAYRLLRGDWPPLQVQFTGFSLEGRLLSRGQDLWVTLAGPAANFLACLGFWSAARYKASYGLYACAAVNLWVGAFNLLPVGPLDGRRLWKLLRDEIAF